MRLLVFGDTHLKRGGENPNYGDVTIPSGTDAVLTLGDVVHQIRPADIAAGREFYSRISEDDSQIFAVPGNHDPAEEHHRLFPDNGAAKLIHNRVVSLGDVDIIGWGCENLQFSPAIRCTDFEALDPRSSSDNRRFAADNAAKRVEKLCHSYAVEGADERTIAARLDIRDGELGDFVEGLRLLRERYERLVELVEAAEPPIIVASHIPPYGTSIDRHHSVGQRAADIDDLHLGSIALKLVLQEYSPALSLSGHSHSEGYETLDTGTEPAHILNFGYQGVGTLSLEDNGAKFSYTVHS